MYPDLIRRQTGPTRKNATLDYSHTNFEEHITNSIVCFPIKSSSNKSDHSLIFYECMLPRPATFAWETHEYMLTNKGTLKFNDLIASEDWSKAAALLPNVEAMVDTFQNILDTHITSCLSWKRVRRRSNDSPWLTDGL